MGKCWNGLFKKDNHSFQKGYNTLSGQHFMDLILMKFFNQLQVLIQMNVIHTHLLLQRCVPSAKMHTSDPIRDER